MSKVILFDFETEGLNLATTRPWQFAYSKIINGKIMPGEEYYIDIPGLKVSYDAARITGFSWEKYNDLKVSANEVVNFIQEEIVESEDFIAAHNGLGFDIYVMRNLYHLVGRELDFNNIVYRFIDTLSLGRGRFYEIEVPENPIDRLSYMYKMLHRPNKLFKGSLSAQAKNFNIDFDPNRLHDALYDIELNAKVYKRLVYGTYLEN